MISNIGEEWSNFKRSEETQNIGIHDLRFTRWCRQRTYSGFGFWGDYQNLVELLEDDNGVCGGRCKIGLVSAFLTLGSLDVAKVRNETSSHRQIWSLTMWQCDLDRNVDNPNRLLKVGMMATKTLIDGKNNHQTKKPNFSFHHGIVRFPVSCFTRIHISLIHSWNLKSIWENWLPKPGKQGILSWTIASKIRNNPLRAKQTPYWPWAYHGPWHPVNGSIWRP